MKPITIKLSEGGQEMPDVVMEKWAKNVLMSRHFDTEIVSNALAITWLQVHIKENPHLGENVSFVLYGVPSEIGSDGLLDWRNVPDMGGANEAFKRLFGF